ncbi:hypothetical protein TGMAS_416350 [Toxoplasma gondii MAS]|uniref:Uncharacterized protein n=1 Tax=Toxoplasma gondii MAS TaxID=943118 RepID=A0A086PXJ6_TOXGO|nr:hypothetical protein TGMAS_416350 [Toxoplasma gondii MAS]
MLSPIQRNSMPRVLASSLTLWSLCFSETVQRFDEAGDRGALLHAVSVFRDHAAFFLTGSNKEQRLKGKTEKNEKRKDQRRRTPEKTEGGKERGGDSAKEGKRRRRRERREGEKGGVKEGEKEGERWKERERRKERPSTEFRLQKTMLLAGWRDLHGRTVGTKADNLCCVVESIRNR